MHVVTCLFIQTQAENDQTIYVYEVKGKVFNCQRKFTIGNKNTINKYLYLIIKLPLKIN